MNASQMRVVLVSMACVIAACLILPWILSSREEARPQSQIPLSFNAANALALAKEFVTQFPSRVLGSLESRQSTGFLQSRLAQLGYAVDYAHFEARISGRTKVGRNVFAYRQGQTPETLVLAAHFDTARTTVQGAMANGAAVGVLLELARVFSDAPTRRSLLIAFTDGEEWGMLGARDLVAGHPFRNHFAAALSLDHVAAGDLAALCLEETGQFKGYAPPWLRVLARKAAEAQGLPVRIPSPLQEHMERALLVSRADQGPFLAQGIPAINLGSLSTDRIRQKAIYHSPDDVIENITFASVEKYGFAAERIARTLDQLPSIPRQSAKAFRVQGSRFVWPSAITLLHILVFLPLPLVFYYHLKNQPGQGLWTLVSRELLACAATVLPFLVLFAGFRLGLAMRLIPQFSAYPATLKDPLLNTPHWGLLGGTFGAAAFIAIACWLVAKFSFLSWPKPLYHASKLALLGIMTITAALALLHNSYWATAFLLLPAWTWALVGPGRTWRKRTGNVVLILAAGIPCYAALWICASKLQMGWNFVWYQVLALTTGMFTPQGYFLAIAAVTLGIRFAIIQAHQQAAGTH